MNMDKQPENPQLSSKMHPKKKMWRGASLAILSLFLGILISVQFKNAEENETYSGYFRTSRVELLTEQLQILQEENQKLQNDLGDLQTKLANVRDENQALVDMKEELMRAEMGSGAVAMRGPGIILTVNDGQKITQGEDPNLLLVHDDDLLRLSNELKASGAEAISINNERLIATSEIRCAGTTILVNWKRLAPPFIIMAIGDPDMLESGMSIKGGYLEVMKYAGLQINLQKIEDVEIPAYSGPFQFEYSSPVIAGGE